MEQSDKPKEMANFGVTGVLAQDAATGATKHGVLLKLSEPEEARVPKQKWRLYVYKGEKGLINTIQVHGQAMYLIGRDRSVVDLPIDHPSASKQHAALVFRQVRLRAKEAAVAAAAAAAGEGGTEAHEHALQMPAQGGALALSAVRRFEVRPYLIDLGSTNGTFLNGERWVVSS